MYAFVFYARSCMYHVRFCAVDPCIAKKRIPYSYVRDYEIRKKKKKKKESGESGKFMICICLP